MDSVRVGIVGLGNMGSNYARMFREGKFQRTKLTAVCDFVGTKLEPYDERLRERLDRIIVLGRLPRSDHQERITMHGAELGRRGVISRRWLRSVICLCIVVLIHSGAAAESVISPEVHSDGTVTFRLSAPKAAEVKADIYCGGLSLLTKDDKGLWSGTLGPLRPGIYSYHFLVDGLRIVDPRNRQVVSYVPPESVLVVKGGKPSIWEIRAVPHGAVHTHWYNSKTTGAERRFHVYTPPDYAAGKRKYPVLCLLHGYGNDDSAWVESGMANAILDNLIADGKAKPMIVVMPYGHIIEPFVERSDVDWDKADSDFRKDVVEGILPIVERNYRVRTKREDRAICGVSMGGRQAMDIDIAYPDAFAWIGLFSSGVMEPKELLKSIKPAEFNKRKKLLWIGCGRQDGLFEGNKNLANELTSNGVKLTWRESDGAHAWLEFRLQLSEFAPLLFR